MTRSLAKKVLCSILTLEQLVSSLTNNKIKSPKPIDVLLLKGILKNLESNFAR